MCYCCCFVTLFFFLMKWVDNAAHQHSTVRGWQLLTRTISREQQGQEQVQEGIFECGKCAVKQKSQVWCALWKSHLRQKKHQIIGAPTVKQQMDWIRWCCNQSAMIKKTHEVAGMLDCNQNATPAVPAALGTCKDREPMNEKWNCRTIVGMLSHLSGNTRPDIALAASQACRFTSAPKKPHASTVPQASSHAQAWALTHQAQAKQNENWWVVANPEVWHPELGSPAGQKALVLQTTPELGDFLEWFLVVPFKPESGVQWLEIVMDLRELK